MAELKQQIQMNIDSQKDERYVKQSFMQPGGDCLIFYDNSPLHPSTVLNNVLQKYRTEWRQNPTDTDVFKIVLVKDKISQMQTEVASLDSSFYCEVVFNKEQKISSARQWELIES